MGVMIYSCCEIIGRVRRLRAETVAAAMATVVTTKNIGRTADARNSGTIIVDVAL